MKTIVSAIGALALAATAASAAPAPRPSQGPAAPAGAEQRVDAAPMQTADRYQAWRDRQSSANRATNTGEGTSRSSDANQG